MPSPFELAARWHLSRCPGESFRDVVEAHFQRGHVISSPDVFLLGRRVRHDWPDDRLRDPWDTDPAGDAWHVWLLAGAPSATRHLVPYPLPWLTFHRRGKRVIIPADALWKKLTPLKTG